MQYCFEKSLKIVFLGATRFSAEILKFLLRNSIEILSVFTIPEYFNISYSKSTVKNFNFIDLSNIAKENKIPCYFVNSERGNRLLDYYEIIKTCKPDVILVAGWYYMIPRKVRNLAKLGAWGLHSSLLPNYAGGAPLVWAIINDESETGVTLFKLDDGVDDGDIIKQRSFPIETYDTISKVYKKATEASKEILFDVFINEKKIKLTKQKKSKIKVFPQRSPEDGYIDFKWERDKIFNFVRAQATPYPGAYFENSKGDKLFIKKIEIERNKNLEIE